MLKDVETKSSPSYMYCENKLQNFNIHFAILSSYIFIETSL